MTDESKQYWMVEHLWRLLRAMFLMIGTGLWLYTDTSPHIIMICYLMAILVDQLHGKICHYIEKILRFKEQHTDWE